MAKRTHQRTVGNKAVEETTATTVEAVETPKANSLDVEPEDGIGATSFSVLQQTDVPVDLITLDEYLKEVPVNEYLVASFKYEASHYEPSLLEPKTRDGWKLALQAQSNRVYE
jgi:hypothetical protein